LSAVLPGRKAISGAAFATLLLIALMMGANHVAARIAFNNGVDVATAVVFRSTVTTLVLVTLLAVQGVRIAFSLRHRVALPAIGLLVGVQSLCLYSAVARLPVALALLAFNTYPIWTAFWARVIYRQRPERAMLLAMPVILFGLALALDVFGATSGLGAAGQWATIGAGVGFALAGCQTPEQNALAAPRSAADGRVDAALRDQVRQIVVIYAENRSFVNLYGNYPGVQMPLSSVKLPLSPPPRSSVPFRPNTEGDNPLSPKPKNFPPFVPVAGFRVLLKYSTLASSTP